MKKLNYLMALIFLSVMLLSSKLIAQDEGTYIDNASPQDSSYTDSDALNFDEYTDDQNSSSNLALILGGAIIVVGAVVVVVLRKKKKK